MDSNLAWTFYSVFLELLILSLVHFHHLKWIEVDNLNKLPWEKLKHFVENSPSKKKEVINDLTGALVKQIDYFHTVLNFPELSKRISTLVHYLTFNLSKT